MKLPLPGRSSGSNPIVNDRLKCVGDGLTPEQQRKDLGDYRISSFTWMFDSEYGYFPNLSSNTVCEEFRRLRAKLRASDKPLTSLALVEG